MCFSKAKALSLWAHGFLCWRADSQPIFSSGVGGTAFSQASGREASEQADNLAEIRVEIRSNGLRALLSIRLEELGQMTMAMVERCKTKMFSAGTLDETTTKSTHAPYRCPLLVTFLLGRWRLKSTSARLPCHSSANQLQPSRGGKAMATPTPFHLSLLFVQMQLLKISTLQYITPLLLSIAYGLSNHHNPVASRKETGHRHSSI